MAFSERDEKRISVSPVQSVSLTQKKHLSFDFIQGMLGFSLKLYSGGTGFPGGGQLNSYFTHILCKFIPPKMKSDFSHRQILECIAFL